MGVGKGVAVATLVGSTAGVGSVGVRATWVFVGSGRIKIVAVADGSGVGVAGWD